MNPNQFDKTERRVGETGTLRILLHNSEKKGMFSTEFSHMIWCNSTGLLEESMLASIKSKL